MPPKSAAKQIRELQTQMLDPAIPAPVRQTMQQALVSLQDQREQTKPKKAKRKTSVAQTEASKDNIKAAQAAKKRRQAAKKSFTLPRTQKQKTASMKNLAKAQKALFGEMATEGGPTVGSSNSKKDKQAKKSRSAAKKVEKGIGEGLKIVESLIPFASLI